MRKRKNRKERSFRVLFMMLLLVALLIAGFWGYKQYGQRVIDYLKYIKENYRIEKVQNPEEEPQSESNGKGQEVEQSTESKEHISMNMIANFLGLGWAATPAGLKAMEELSKLEEER